MPSFVDIANYFIFWFWAIVMVAVLCFIFYRRGKTAGREEVEARQYVAVLHGFRRQDAESTAENQRYWIYVRLRRGCDMELVEPWVYSYILTDEELHQLESHSLGAPRWNHVVGDPNKVVIMGQVCKVMARDYKYGPPRYFEDH